MERILNMIKFVYKYTICFENGDVIETTYTKKQKNSALAKMHKNSGKITKVTINAIEGNSSTIYPHKYHSENRRKFKRAWNKAVRNNRAWVIY